VECTFLGAKGIGGQILDRYCRTSCDIPPKKLLSFYMCYRACVRAKVQAIRAGQVNSATQQRPLRLAAQQYLQLADEYARELGPPLLLIVRGLMGTGKSTLATALQQSLEIELLQTDALRRDLLGSSDQPVLYGEDHYSWENRLTVYEEMLRRAESILANGRSVILDGTFLTRALRARAASLARRHQAIPVVLHCRCPDELVRERMTARLARRESLSEARPELLEQQKREEEPDPPGISACEIDTRASVPEMTKAVLQHLNTTITDE
jgi:predicted kinase